MGKYYEEYKTLIVSAALGGLYFPCMEKIYKGKPWIKLLKGITIFPLVTLPLYFVFNLKFLVYEEGGFLGKIFGVTQGVYLFFTSFILFNFYCSRNDYEKVFQMWDNLFQENLFPENRQKILRKKKRTTELWLIIFGSLSVGSAYIHGIVVYFNPEKKLSHPSGIPYKHQSPDFEIAATFDLLASVTGFTLLIIYDSITMVFLSLEDAQFEHLKESLGKIIGIISLTESGEVIINNNKERGDVSDIFQDSDLDVVQKWRTKEALNEVDKNMRIWVSQHQQLLGFHDELRKIYKVPLSVKFIAFVLIICLCSFLMVAEGGFTFKDKIIATIFCCVNYTIFYVNIRFGDAIRDTSETIFDEAFIKSWHLYPAYMKSNFRIILMRERRRVQYVALNIYPLSSQSFLKILSSAYSFFTFLLHVIRKKQYEGNED